MKNFFKRFGVVFLAVMFLFCSLTVSVFAEEAPPDQTDQTETTVVDSTMIEDVNSIMPLDDGMSFLDFCFYYIPPGWTCEVDEGSFLSEEIVGYIIVPDHSYYFSSIVVGSSVDEITVSIYDFSEELFCDDVFTPEEGFLLCSVDLAISYLDAYRLESGGDYFFSPFVFEEGWSVSAELLLSSGFSNNISDFYLNGVLYENYNIDLGFTVVDNEIVPCADSIVFSPKVGGSESDYIVFDNTESFTFQLIESDLDLVFYYFLVANAEIIPPPTLMESILDIFLSVGEWISGAVSALIPLFWDSSAGALTFVGVLSVSGLAFSVSMLLISLISKFLRFGG